MKSNAALQVIEMTAPPATPKKVKWKPDPVYVVRKELRDEAALLRRSGKSLIFFGLAVDFLLYILDGLAYVTFGSLGTICVMLLGLLVSFFSIFMAMIMFSVAGTLTDCSATLPVEVLK